MDRERAKVKPLPIIIGPANAEACTGFPWRWCRDQAVALGLPFVGAGKKRGIRADVFVEAMEKSGSYTDGTDTNGVAAAPPTFTPADTAAHVRALLGKKLKAGVRC